MKKVQNDSRGFAWVELVMVLVVVGIIGFVGFKVMKRSEPSNSSQSPQQSSKPNNAKDVRWSFDQQKLEWMVKEGAAPKCVEPFKFDNSPVDLSLVTNVGMPGAYRGFNYKPHGLFRLADSTNGNTQVVMPTNATLVSLTRYLEGAANEVQYLLTFENDCGIAFRFDHLFTLSPEFQKIAETTPEPKKDDSSTDPNRPFARTKFKAGDVIATTVGFPSNRNYGFDFGVYDYRSRNEISKNKKWADIHNSFQASEWHGRCWLDMLPGSDSAKATSLANAIANTNKPEVSQISDYCSNAKYKTLDFNDGQPTDG